MQSSNRWQLTLACLPPPLAITRVLDRGKHVVVIPGTHKVERLHELARAGRMDLSKEDIARIDADLPEGRAQGGRYPVDQWDGPERCC